MIEPDIKISSPNMIKKYWRWSVKYEETSMQGKAATEPEAHRLAKDAAKYLKNKKPLKHCPYCNSIEVIVFTADDDICLDCKRYFPGS